MTKKDFIKVVASEVNQPQIVVESIYDAILEQQQKELIKGNDVKLPGIGTLKNKDVAARKNRNPKTGETIMTPAKKAIKFKASSIIKEEVNR